MPPPSKRLKTSDYSAYLGDHANKPEPLFLQARNTSDFVVFIKENHTVACGYCGLRQSMSNIESKHWKSTCKKYPRDEFVFVPFENPTPAKKASLKEGSESVSDEKENEMILRARLEDIEGVLLPRLQKLQEAEERRKDEAKALEVADYTILIESRGGNPEKAKQRIVALSRMWSEIESKSLIWTESIEDLKAEIKELKQSLE